MGTTAQRTKYGSTILNVFEHYDIEGMGFNPADYIHTFVEAKLPLKIALSSMRIQTSTILIDWLISKEYAAKRQKFIDNGAANRGDAGIYEGDTIYLTVADKEGNMVSLIQSNYRGMGSGMTPG